MLFSVIVSRKDLAGLNIAKQLGKLGLSEEKSGFSQLELVFIEEDQIFADSVNEADGDVVVFASKHASASEKPTLTVHGIGNWGEDNSYGGKKKELVPTSAFLLKNYLIELENQKQEKKLDYEVILECTHHGPFLEKPAVFIELGSCEKQWRDEKAALAIAETIVNATSLKGNYKCVVGVGGPHYPREFTKLVLRTEYAFSHICPEYNLRNLNEEMLGKAVEASVEEVQGIILDWKGLGKEKAGIKNVLSEFAIPVKRVRNILNEK